MSSNYTIESINFGPDGVRVMYMTTTDVRDSGAIYQAHTIAVSWEVEDDGLQTLMRELEDKGNEFLRAAILQWARTTPVDLVAERQKIVDEADDDDEGLGGGDGLDDPPDVSRA